LCVYLAPRERRRIIWKFARVFPRLAYLKYLTHMGRLEAAHMRVLLEAKII
jgi:hypothetical protein